MCMLEEESRLKGCMSGGWRGTCVYVRGGVLEEESRLEGHMCVYVGGGV